MAVIYNGKIGVFANELIKKSPKVVSVVIRDFLANNHII